MSRYKTLAEVTPGHGFDDDTPLTGDHGIFWYIFRMSSSFRFPWIPEGQTAIDWSDQLDLEYYVNRSGDKLISPLIAKMLNNADVLTDSQMSKIASMLVPLYLDKWTKLWDSYNLEYNPIQNYNMVEQLRDQTEETTFDTSLERELDTEHKKTGTEKTDYNSTDTRTLDIDHTKTGTETTTPDITETRTPSTTVTQADGIYGFNSDESSAANTRDTVTSGTETVTTEGDSELEYNTTEADDGTDTLVRSGYDQLTHNVSDTDDGTITDTKTGTETTTKEYDLTRSGNIGVTTTQQMIEQERALWAMDYFHAVVFPDLDTLLTLPIY